MIIKVILHFVDFTTDCEKDKHHFVPLTDVNIVWRAYNYTLFVQIFVHRLKILKFIYIPYFL